MPMTTLDQPNKTNISIPKLDDATPLPDLISDELSEFHLGFPWLFKEPTDELAELQQLFPWLSGPSP